MRAEEEKLAALQQKLAALVHRENALLAAWLKAGMELVRQHAIGGAEFQALSAYQIRIRSERATLQTAKLQCEKVTNEQRKILLKARKEVRVLEKLKEKRYRTWVYSNDREIEEGAAEAYLSRWSQPEGRTL